MVTANKPKDLYRSFYTKSDEITKFMVAQLELENGDRVLEPSAGDGEFIDQVLNTNKRVNIVAFEIDPKAITQLNNKYSKSVNVQINFADVLTSENLTSQAELGLLFDKIIANPPYGGWQDYEKRKTLKTLFPGFYVRETYALFLIRCISLLREGGILSFIIPDTFLNVHMHKNLRKYVLQNTLVKNINLIPSNFFPSVDFGYANLAIVTLQKSLNINLNSNNIMKIVSDVQTVDVLNSLSTSDLYKKSFLRQKEVLETMDHAFLINGPRTLRNAINNANKTIGHIADCVTGFYSGNNSKFLRVSSRISRNPSKCPMINESLIANNIPENRLINGIQHESKSFIPIVKGGAEKYVKGDDWFVDWSMNAVSHYKSCKKARFQNSQFYFKTGIAVPMVTSSRVSAALIENKLFDQSVVGIFPKDRAFLYYLLGFFNSDVCTTILKTINHTANNSSAYIKKIPFLPPTENELIEVDGIVKTLIALKKKGDLALEDFEKNLNVFFNAKYKGLLH